MKLRHILSSAAVAAALAQPLPALAADQATRDLLRARLAAQEVGDFGSPMLTPVLPRAGDRLAEAIVSWDRLRRTTYSAPFSEYARFLEAYPGWPQESLIRGRAEASLSAGAPFAERIRLFERLPPRTGTGAYRLAEAYSATGNREAAQRWARTAWTSDDLPAAEEAEMLARMGPMLGPDDHLGRVDALLWAGRATQAERIIPLMPQDARPWALARVALIRKAPNAQVLAAAVTGRWAENAGLIHDLVNHRNETDFVGARRLIAERPIAPGSVTDPVRWLKLRYSLSRAAENDGQFELAYRIAADHRAVAPGRPLADRPFAERDALTDIEWLAGWVAFHDLRRPADALVHFTRYGATAQTATTRTKGLYWAGRAAERSGEAATARKLFAEAAQYGDAFYGQLAQERLGRPISVGLAGPAPVSSAERAAFAEDSRVQAARLLGEINDRARQAIFLRGLAEAATTPAERQLAAELGLSVGRREVAVIASKRGRAAGEPPRAYGWPLIELGPQLAGQRVPIHAISRQETQFDTEAVSRANARGLMQLLPGTAREQAGKIGAVYDFDRLTRDPAYNALLGSSYYARLRDSWGGNTVLAVASYNAGSGNVRRWVARNGDPRLPGVDVIEWIEAIPFEETRNYVQRVLENAVIYESLTNGGRVDGPRLSALLGKPGPG